MARVTNPFNPHGIAGELYGRQRELDAISNLLQEALDGRFGHFALIGERGVGKSSVLRSIKRSASSSSPPFAVIRCPLRPKTTIRTLVTQLRTGIDAAVFAEDFFERWWHRGKSLAKSVKSDTIRIETGPEPDDPEILLDDFALKLCALAKKKPGGFAGFLLLLDEADLASEHLDFGGVLKTLVEHLQFEGCSNVVIGLGGLPDVKSRVTKSHPSTWRMFHTFDLLPLDQESAKDLVVNTIRSTDSKGTPSVPTGIDPDAVDALVLYSQGFPHFLQEMGAAVWDCAKSALHDVITPEDFWNGFFRSVQIIGDKYYHADFDRLPATRPVPKLCRRFCGE